MGTVSDCGLRTFLTILREVVRLDMVGNVGAFGMSVAALGLEAFERSEERKIFFKNPKGLTLQLARREATLRFLFGFGFFDGQFCNSSYRLPIAFL